MSWFRKGKKNSVVKVGVPDKEPLRKENTPVARRAIVIDGPRKFCLQQAGEYYYDGFSSIYELVGFVDVVFDKEELLLVKEEVLRPLKQGKRPWKWRFEGCSNPYEVDGFIHVEFRESKLHDMLERAAAKTDWTKPKQGGP